MYFNSEIRCVSTIKYLPDASEQVYSFDYTQQRGIERVHRAIENNLLITYQPYKYI